MTPQLVDLNADGYQDMVMGTFEGTVFLVAGSEDGFQPPAHIRDKNGELVRISMYWDLDESEYLYVDRTTENEPYEKGHHLTSAAVVDWDDDGDLDLLLGAYEGALYRCMNEGTESEPKFSDKNLQVKAGGKHLTLEGGLATPIICDWNGDGLFDILCGGSKGGVYYYKNIGKPGEPVFAPATTLIDKLLMSPGSTDYYTSQMVPTVDGQPACPGTGLHINAVDYDGDGDLDLLVGGQSYYEQEKKELTAEEKKELAALKSEQADLQKQLQEMMEGKTDQDSLKELYEDAEFKKLMTRNSELYQESQKIDPSPRAATHVWLFRNKGNDSPEDSTYTSTRGQ